VDRWQTGRHALKADGTARSLSGTGAERHGSLTDLRKKISTGDTGNTGSEEKQNPSDESAIGVLAVNRQL
jgi:hypothetical protein